MDLVPGPPPPGFRVAMARTYDGVAAEREARGEEPWRWPIARRFLDLLRREGRTRLVELGAGVGYTSRWFADRGIDVLATDLSPAQVELCRRKGLDARVADLHDLDLEPGSFDAAWTMNAIHHVAAADLPGVLCGIADVLVPGGPLYLGVWGGVDREGVPGEDFYLPPRFFSFRTDEALRAAVADVFTIEWFEAFDPGPEPDPDGLHMQSMVLRAPR